MSDCEFVIPKSVDYFTFWDVLKHIADAYKAMINAKVQKEDARMILSNATPTTLAFTVNARALVEISGQRLCNRAQKEIRELFQSIKKEVAVVCPEIAALMLPKCEQHEIPFCEESNCCGKHKRLTELVK